MKWHDLDCHVVVNGMQLTEYEDPEPSSDEKTTTCWIASQSGSEYHVELQIHGTPPKLPLRYQLFIDNNPVYCGLRRAESWKSALVLKGIVVDHGTKIRNFQFAALNPSDDDNAPTRDIAGLGTIRLALCQCHVPEEVVPTVYKSSNVLDREHMINEKCKKLAQHCTLLGVARPNSDPPTKSFMARSMQDSLDEYRHTFTFKYQPIELLQARDIAPHPSQSESVKDSSGQRKHDVICKEQPGEDELEQDQVLEELCRLKEQKRRLQQECQERLNDIAEELTRLKAGRSRSRKRVKLEYQERLTALDGQVFEISD